MDQVGRAGRRKRAVSRSVFKPRNDAPDDISGRIKNFGTRRAFMLRGSSAWAARPSRYLPN
jgi:hypothetical protein